MFNVTLQNIQNSVEMHAQQRRLEVLQHHLLSFQDPGSVLGFRGCKAHVSRPEHKVATANAAVARIPDNAVVTVGRFLLINIAKSFIIAFHTCGCITADRKQLCNPTHTLFRSKSIASSFFGHTS